VILVVVGIAAAAAAVVAAWLAFRGQFARRRLQVDHVLRLDLERSTGDVLEAWLIVKVRNIGRRPVTIDYAGVRLENNWRAEIPLGDAIRIDVDGTDARVATRIGPVLAAGVDPLSTRLIAWAKSPRGKVWEGTAHPVLQPPPPPGTTPQQVGAGLARLAASAQQPSPRPPPPRRWQPVEEFSHSGSRRGG
jgi:hypothetical protein